LVRPTHRHPHRRYRAEGESCSQTAVEAGLFQRPVKAETNFADVVPQAKGLRISLNIEPHEISDPRGLVEDVTGIGRWGNGNSEVRLTSIDDLAYVVGLARQALEHQLDEDEAA
ncbi:MAG: hypothetical protein KDB22_28160, partial [Planctomycetales bacterium]|nr:hypothetical protein [Planctomycetales bacterium]